MGRAANQKRFARAAREEKAERTRIAEERGCLICRRVDGGFKSQEHPFPESLGNTDIVLLNGIVCDRCNNGHLATLDQALCDFLPIKMRLAMLGVRSKAQKVPIVRFATGTLQNTGPNSILIESQPASPLLREVDRTEQGVSLRLSGQGGKRLAPRYCAELSNGTIKAAFELAWFDHGDRLFESRFDAVREVILGGARHGYLVAATQCDPDHHGVALSYWLHEENDQTHLSVAARYYGVTLVTDSFRDAPPGEIDPALGIVLSFKPSEVRRR